MQSFFIKAKFVDIQDVQAVLEVQVLQPAGQITHVFPESLYPAGHVTTLSYIL